jgi:Uma2 family endonuclease
MVNPVLLIEVLSPSTALVDREFKAERYKRIAMLREYALVSQPEARVEVYHRREGAPWPLSEFAGLEAAARFDGVEASVPLAEIYDKVTFEEEAL